MSSISKRRSYLGIGEFWDKHSLSQFWHKTRKVKVTAIKQNRKRQPL